MSTYNLYKWVLYKIFNRDYTNIEIKDFIYDPAVDYVPIIWWYTMQQEGKLRISLTFCLIAYTMETWHFDETFVSLHCSKTYK